jgi:hypothetical protein
MKFFNDSNEDSNLEFDESISLFDRDKNLA